MEGFTFKMTIMMLLGIIELVVYFFFGYKDASITTTIWLSAVTAAAFTPDLSVDIKRRSDIE
jgi:hypothetical protein